MHTLDTALMPPRVPKPWYLLVKDPINIPFESTEKLENPRLDNYSPRNSLSLTKDLGELRELDAMLHTQLETEGLTRPTTYEPIDDTAPEEDTPASEWIILESIGIIDDF